MDLDGNGGWSPLKMAFHEGKIQATFNIGSNPELPSRGHFLCGEQAKCHVLLTFRNGLKPTEELASSISAQIENFEVSVDEGSTNGLAPANGTRKTGVSDTALFVVAKDDFRRSSKTSPTIHKMHSIESLTSFSQETVLSPKQTANLPVARNRAQGQLWNETSIYIPLEMWVDSPLDFTEAHVHVSVSIFERRKNDIIKELLSKPKLGSVLLRDLLLEDASDALLNPSVTERVWSIDKIYRILRPITAEMKCNKVSPAQLNICVTVVNSLAFADEGTYSISYLELLPEETLHGNRHVINIHPHNHPSQMIQLGPSGKADFEFSLRVNKTEPSAQFPRLRLLVALRSEEIEDTEGIHLAFESDVNLDDLFPERQSDTVIISLSGPSSCDLNSAFYCKVFIENRTNKDQELVLCIKDAIKDDNSPLFVALDIPPTPLPAIKADRCHSVFFKLLALRRGTHSLSDFLQVEYADSKTPIASTNDYLIKIT